MKPPRVRFTLQGMMLGVAIVALAFGGEVARRRWVAGPSPVPSLGQMEAVALAAKHLGTEHWAASSSVGAMVLQDTGSGCWIYGRKWERLPSGLQNETELAFMPFVVIWRSLDGHHVKVATGDIAFLTLDDPKGLKDPVLHLRRARLEGNVGFRDNKGNSSLNNDLVVDSLSTIELDDPSYFGLELRTRNPQK